MRKNIRFGWTLEHMPRKKMFEYPPKVVKEAITNAVAHRDLTQNATIRVAIFDDRIEVWSPGKLPEGVTIENLEDACQSLSWILFGSEIQDEYFGTEIFARDCLRWDTLKRGGLELT